MKNKLAYDFGINDLHEPVSVDGKSLPFYRTWHSMIDRCYSSKYQTKNPTYIGCSVCDEWKYLSNFKKWFDENHIEGFELDKDILVEGNKVYSPETCRFVPHYLNSLLTKRENARGDLPLGVVEKKPDTKTRKINTTYQALCNNGYGVRITKIFKTVEEASAWYSSTKKRVVKEQAIRAFLDNAIKTDIYLALVRRNFGDECTGTHNQINNIPVKQ